jgi:branched-chain amino acid transport system ATP-binding protein
MSTLLDVDGLSLAFGGVRALDAVSFTVEEGSITAVIGPNGAGKTTLFNAISGLYRPDAGRVRFAERDITRLPAAKRAGLGLARTFQNIALFQGMDVLGNIKLGCHAHTRSGLLEAGFYMGPARAEEMRVRAEIERTVIDFLEIDHIRNVPVGMLPYGLQKRVELARALAMRPKLLLLDEPVAGMNREETEDMARFVLDVREQRGVTVLLVEHDMDVVMDISDHVVALNFGKVIGAGPPAAVREADAVIEAYLGAGASTRDTGV